MKLLDSAKQKLQQHYLQLLGKLEQAVKEYCLSDDEQERKATRQHIKDYTRQLVLLEPFYRIEVNPQDAEKLSCLCALITRENIDSEECQQLLTGFYRSLDKLA